MYATSTKSHTHMTKKNCSHFYFQITGHYGKPYLGSLKLCDAADLIHGWRFPRNYQEKMIMVTPEKEKDSCQMQLI